MPTWIRVKDDVTGDEYDVDETAVRRGMTPIEGYPENSGPDARPRPPKPLVSKGGEEPQPDAGQTTTPTRAKQKTTPAEPADTNKENS